MPPSAKTVSSATVALDLGEEEVDPAEQAVQLVARLRDRLADLARQRRGQRLELGDDRGAKARRSPPCARPAAAPPRPAARRARAPPWRRRWRRRRPAARRSARRGGVGDLRRSEVMVAGRRARPRGSRRAAGRSSSVPSPRAVELGMPLHRGHEAAGPGFRIASIMPSLGQRASTTKPGGQVLDALVVDAVDRRPRRALEDLAPAGVPGDELDRVEVAVVDLGVAVPHRARAAACRCPGAACRRSATFISCRPRQMPSTGLPRAREGGAAGPARSRRGRGRRCQRSSQRRLAVAARRQTSEPPSSTSASSQSA